MHGYAFLPHLGCKTMPQQPICGDIERTGWSGQFGTMPTHLRIFVWASCSALFSDFRQGKRKCYLQNNRPPRQGLFGKARASLQVVSTARSIHVYVSFFDMNVQGMLKCLSACAVVLGCIKPVIHMLKGHRHFTRMYEYHTCARPLSLSLLCASIK